MGDLKTSYIINLGGNLARKARQYSQALGGFSSRGQRHLNRLKQTAAIAGRGVDHLTNRYTAFFTGGAAIGAGNFVVGLDDRFTQLGIQANKSIEEMDLLKQKIFEVAQNSNIRINPGELTGAIEEIVERTGDLEFAKDNLDTLAMAISATSSAGKDIGGIGAEFQKQGIKLPADFLLALDVLNVQGKEGAFTLRDIAQLGPRVVTAYTAMGRSGVPAMREMGAALQIIKRGVGSPDQAATAFEAMLRTLSDPKKIKMLKSGGIKVFDEKALKKGKEILRPIHLLMGEIVKATNGRATLINRVFDAEAARAFNSLVTDYKDDGELQLIERFYNVHADGSATLQDSQRKARNAAGAIRYLTTSLQLFADNRLTDPIRGLADSINDIEPETVKTWLNVASGIAAAGAAAVGFNLAYKTARNVKSLFGGKKGLPNTAGDLLGGGPNFPIPLPVIIVGDKMGKYARDRAAGKSRAGGAGKTANTAGKVAATTAGMSLLSKAGYVAGSGYAGYEVGTLIYDNVVKDTKLAELGGEAIARVLAFFGNDEAQRALDINERLYQERLKRRTNPTNNSNNNIEQSQSNKSARSHIVLEVKGNQPVSVERIQSNDLTIDVDTGLMGAGT